MGPLLHGVQPFDDFCVGRQHDEPHEVAERLLVGLREQPGYPVRRVLPQAAGQVEYRFLLGVAITVSGDVRNPGAPLAGVLLLDTEVAGVLGEQCQADLFSSRDQLVSMRISSLCRLVLRHGDIVTPSR